MTSNVTRPKLRVQMPVTIPTAALRLMSEADRERLIRDAFDSSPEALSNYLAVLDALIRVFEQRYELPSASLDDALGSGQLRDTADVSEWLFLAHLRSDLAGKAPP